MKRSVLTVMGLLAIAGLLFSSMTNLASAVYIQPQTCEASEPALVDEATFGAPFACNANGEGSQWLSDGSGNFPGKSFYMFFEDYHNFSYISIHSVNYPAKEAHLDALISGSWVEIASWTNGTLTSNQTYVFDGVCTNALKIVAETNRDGLTSDLNWGAADIYPNDGEVCIPVVIEIVVIGDIEWMELSLWVFLIVMLLVGGLKIPISLVFAGISMIVLGIRTFAFTGSVLLALMLTGIGVLIMGAGALNAWRDK